MFVQILQDYTHSRRPSPIEEIGKTPEPSPCKSQFSDLVCSIGSPNPSLASTEPSISRRHSLTGTNDNIIILPWNSGMEISERVGTAKRDILYQTDKNGTAISAEDFTGDPDDPRVPRKGSSKAKVFPSGAGLAARDAFGKTNFASSYCFCEKDRF